MSSQVCSTSCGALVNPPAQYSDICSGTVFRRYGSSFFALVKCDVNIPDPTDISAWQSLIDSGDIAVSPCGKIDIASPDVETDQISGCGNEEAIETTYNIVYTTYETADDRSDYSYFKALLANYSNQRLIWFDCDSYAFMQDEYVDFINGNSAVAPVGNPGFEFSISSPPHPVEGSGRRVRWEVTFQIDLNGNRIVCPAYVDGLLGALQA